MSTIQEVAGQYDVDMSEIVITGYSLGAQEGWKLLNENPGTFAGGVLMSGWTDIDPSNFTSTPVYATAGSTEGGYGGGYTGKMNELAESINSAGGNAHYEDYVDAETGNDHTGHYDTPNLLNEDGTWDLM